MEFLRWTSSRSIHFQDVVMRMGSYSEDSGWRGARDVPGFAQHRYTFWSIILPCKWSWQKLPINAVYCLGHRVGPIIQANQNSSTGCFHTWLEKWVAERRREFLSWALNGKDMILEHCSQFTPKSMSVALISFDL